jgi:putative phage-type endonuclease
MTQDRKAWLEQRKKGIGASEVASILGVSPWEGATAVWLRKKGLIQEQPDNERFRIGRLFEDPIAKLYEARENVKLEGDGMQTIFHPTLPIFATPDRLVVGRPRGVEIKTVNPMMAGAWGEEGSDQIPDYYVSQVAVCMAITNRDEWDVAAFFSMDDFRVYRLYRDKELEEMILTQVTAFWNEFVVGNKEPPVEGSKHYADFLHRKYPSNVMPMLAASEQDDNDIGCLLALRVRKKDIEEEETLFENIVKARIGENDGIQSHLGKITWKKTKDVEKVNWEAVARELHPAIPQPLIEKHTEVKPGVRRFLVSPSKLPMRKGAL